MKYGLYSIRDAKIGYMTPWVSHNDQTAIRTINTASQEKEPNAINTNAEDKSLYRIGWFDDQEGSFEPNHELLIDVPERRPEPHGDNK